ncbi:MAG TPA: glycosyltransferase [Candidatus Eisenbacteria bacterium]|jgi:glycosyltransferase involved in cell wall biosynthesis
MRIGLFLPHVAVFGGVRRYLELGNEWTALGHRVTLFHPEGTAPAWLPFAGATAPLAAAAGSESDLAVTGDAATYAAFRAHAARHHVYYCVLEGDPGLPAALADPAVLLMANSGPLRERLRRDARRSVLDGVGGIRRERFRPEPARRAAAPLRVLVNGRRSRAKKGTDLVLRALRGIGGRAPAFETVLFDAVDPATNRQDPRDGAPLPANARFVMNPTQDELAALYQSSHVFVAAEKKAGWCNTAIEALASGCALVCTRSGTTDFARNGENALVTLRHPWFLRRAIARLLADAALRERLSAAGPASVARWEWRALAARILEQLPDAP